MSGLPVSWMKCSRVFHWLQRMILTSWHWILIFSAWKHFSFWKIKPKNISIFQPNVAKWKQTLENIDKDEDTLSGARGARGVMVIIVGNEHGDSSSNPGREWLHFT